MNQQSYPRGFIPSSSEPLMKRRRGRPRKEDSLVHHAAKLTPIQPSLAMESQIHVMKPTNEQQSFIPPFQQPQSDLDKGKARVEDVNVNRNGGIKEDEMIGQVVTGVLEGMFDAGYFLSVKVGESDMRLKGLVFQPGKFVPVTSENDIAPSAKMYSRIDVPVPGLNLKTSHVSMGCESSIVQEGLVYDSKETGVAMKDVQKPSEVMIVEEPSEVFMQCDGFVGKGGGEEMVMETGVEEKDVVLEKAVNGSEGVAVFVEPKQEGSSEMEVTLIGTEKAVEAGNKTEHLSIPRLELALSSSFDIQVPTNFQLDEGQQNAPQQTLDLLTATSAVNVESKEDVGGHYVMLEPLAKKQKIDQAINSDEVASSEAEVITTPREVVESHGFINLACSIRPMETD